MNRDTLTGLVGALVLIAAMLGVFFYERGVAEDAGIGAPGDADATPGFSAITLRGTATLGEVDTQIANVTATTPTSVTFHLAWTATNGADTLQLTVAPPTGSGITEGGASEPSDTGEISLTVEVPEGASPAGGWEVKVEFVSARPDPLPGGIPPPTPPPGSTDATVAYTITVAPN
jgi:hypothetical protein